MAKRKRTPKLEPKLKILVSSAVYGYEDMLESIYVVLETFGYDVLMSHKGTLPVDPAETALDCCLDAVRECDLFLGIILPRYGSGKEGDDLSITHKEIIEAIDLNKPRWFLVHEHVAIARQLLGQYRKKDADDNDVRPFEFETDMQYKRTSVLSDIRVIDMFELAMRHDQPKLKNRYGNWVQHYGPKEDARLFATAQFRRYRELAEKHLPKLEPIDQIRKRSDNNVSSQSKKTSADDATGDKQ